MELFAKASPVTKGGPCVHRRLWVGDGYVAINKGESIQRFFEKAEEADEDVSGASLFCSFLVVVRVNADAMHLPRKCVLFFEAGMSFCAVTPSKRRFICRRLLLRVQFKLDGRQTQACSLNDACLINLCHRQVPAGLLAENRHPS